MRAPHTSNERETTRFCTYCKEYLPLERFPNGVRRYTCIQHVSQMYKKTYVDRLKKCAESAAAYKAYDNVFRDAKDVFQTTSSFPWKDLKGIIDREGQGIVPVDPLQGMSPTNYAKVTEPWQRLVLLKNWRLCKDVQSYQHLLRSIIVSPAETAESETAESETAETALLPIIDG